MTSEPDFNCPHGKTFRVVDSQGTELAAYYEGDTWWLGHADEGLKVQTEHPIVALTEPQP